MQVKKNRILLVLTGGTIGSICQDGVRDIAGDSPYLLLREFRRVFPGYADCDFTVITPCCLLSENLTCDVWQTLYEAVTEAVLNGSGTPPVDGVLIAHGSDTLAYTAAAMGMLLRHLPCPVVLTAADRPINDPKGNGLGNFRAAVDFILHAARRGVYVSYRRNADGVQVIYPAARLRAADCFLDEFSAYGGVPLGVMEDGAFRADPSPMNLPEDAFRTPLSPLAPSGLTLTDRRILLLHSYPGLDYAAIDPAPFAAVVQYGYHCATACTEGERTSLLGFAARCRQAGTDLWLGAFKHAEDELYATTDELLRAGILPFYDMSPEAAYVKAVLAYHLPDTDPRAFMNRCAAYEIVGQPVEVA